jgi:hypothetical protein
MSASLFNHFVCAGKERRGHGETKRFGGLEINHQLVLVRRLNREISRFLSFQDAIDVVGCKAEKSRSHRHVDGCNLVDFDAKASQARAPPLFRARNPERIGGSMLAMQMHASLIRRGNR